MLPTTKKYRHIISKLKEFIYLAVLLITSLGFMSCAGPGVYRQAADRKYLGDVQSIAIIPFTGDISFVNLAENTLTTHLLANSIIETIERTRLLEILEEKQLSMTELLSKSPQEIGRILGVDAVFFGNIRTRKIPGLFLDAYFTGELVDADSERILIGIKRKSGLLIASSLDECVVAASKRAAMDLAKALALERKMPWGVAKRHRIIEVKGKRASLLEIDEAPKRDVRCKDGYAIVVGIEKYRDLPQVEFAQKDARVVREYLIKTMGFPEANIVTLLNERALRSDLGKYFETWLKNNISKDSTLFIYYAGHGAPGLKDNKAYLVPYDGDPNYPEKTCYPLDSVYASLDKLPAKEIIVAVDSCFSGAGGRSVVAEGARPMVISVENPVLASGNTVVLTAATEKQIASFYPEAKHGIFTYFFLKGLRGEGDLDGDGWVELKELYDYLKPKVTGIARRMNREQTPVILPSLEILSKRGGYRLTKAK